MSILKSLAIVLIATISLHGCGFMVGAAAGGAAGYKMKEEGYEVQSPVKKEDKQAEGQ